MADNLDLPQVAANQDQKEVTINDAFTQLSGAMTDDNSYSLASADVTLSLTDFQEYLCFFVTGTNSTYHTFTLPEQKRTLFMVQNLGTYVLSVILGTTTLLVLPGATAFFRQDGTANGLTKISPASQQSMAFSLPGRPYSSLNINIPINEPMSLPIGLVGSNFSIGTNPTSTLTWTIYHVVAGTPTSIGTIAFATSGAVTVTFTSLVSFAAGDGIRFTAPGTVDATGADFGFNFLTTLL